MKHESAFPKEHPLYKRYRFLLTFILEFWLNPDEIASLLSALCQAHQSLLEESNDKDTEVAMWATLIEQINYICRKQQNAQINANNYARWHQNRATLLNLLYTDVTQVVHYSDRLLYEAFSIAQDVLADDEFDANEMQKIRTWIHAERPEYDIGEATMPIELPFLVKEAVCILRNREELLHTAKPFSAIGNNNYFINKRSTTLWPLSSNNLSDYLWHALILFFKTKDINQLAIFDIKAGDDSQSSVSLSLLHLLMLLQHEPIVKLAIHLGAIPQAFSAHCYPCQDAVFHTPYSSATFALFFSTPGIFLMLANQDTAELPLTMLCHTVDLAFDAATANHALAYLTRAFYLVDLPHQITQHSYSLMCDALTYILTHIPRYYAAQSASKYLNKALYQLFKKMLNQYNKTTEQPSFHYEVLQRCNDVLSTALSTVFSQKNKLEGGDIVLNLPSITLRLSDIAELESYIEHLCELSIITLNSLDKKDGSLHTYEKDFMANFEKYSKLHNTTTLLPILKKLQYQYQHPSVTKNILTLFQTHDTSYSLALARTISTLTCYPQR